ncbi:concanavalin A-like lectin/glucanase domain-containing protein [Phaeosphaeriaceae sp. PMI808]|nr:concanavalin A-like lectin/glucanase domain-containing protein [Phaeosphaeriaceae sp. PMI808]
MLLNPPLTNVFLSYLNESDARARNLISISNNSTYIGVDYESLAPNGRASIRLESKRLYKKGLFVLDLAHMPASTPGTWPSLWMWDAEKTWPELGKIDIIEGIHNNAVNAMSLHTADGCSIDGRDSKGAIDTKNCYITAPNQNSNAGCGMASSSAASFGTPFNTARGGIFATEWTSQFIKIWFFPRALVPADLQAGGNVNPTRWGTADASFQGACNFDERFGAQRIVLDTTFCGDWGGAVWDTL